MKAKMSLLYGAAPIFLLAAACTIENDLDYPVVPGNITSFEVAGQISSAISTQSRTVEVVVPEDLDRTTLTITALTLSENAKCEELSVGSVIDLSSPVSVHVVTYQDYIWTVYSTVSIDSEIDVNAWSSRADFSSDQDGSQETGHFEWKESGAGEWTVGEDISPENGVYSYTVEGLTPGTDYYVRLVRESETSEEVAFSTEEEAQVANMSLDEWCTETVYTSKTCWYPAPDVSIGRVWDSANKGVLMMSSSCATTPEEEFVAVGGTGKKAARMEARYSGIGSLGRFAAGNLLTGEFVSVSGFGAEMDWGIPFTTRPSSMKGYYAYQPATIDHDDVGNNPDLIGESDVMQILVILGDWDNPYRINTSEDVFLDQENDANIIAYGKLESSEATLDSSGNLQYVEFECTLDYRDLTRKPKYVIINCCTSKYGDYFTGGTGSLLYVDELEFVY